MARRFFARTATVTAKDVHLGEGLRDLHACSIDSPDKTKTPPCMIPDLSGLYARLRCRRIDPFSFVNRH